MNKAAIKSRALKIISDAEAELREHTIPANRGYGAPHIVRELTMLRARTWWIAYGKAAPEFSLAEYDRERIGGRKE